MSMRSQPQKTDAVSRQRPPLRKVLLFSLVMFAAIATIIFLSGLLIFRAVDRQRHEGKAVANGVQVSTFTRYESENIYPLGIAASDDGDLYLSQFGAGQIVRLDHEGKSAPWLDSSKGIKAPGPLAAAGAHLYVIDYASADPTRAVGQLKRIDDKGAAAVTNEALPLFAQVAADRAGNLYVTNPRTGSVWQCKAGGACNTRWWAAPPLGNKRPQTTAIGFNPANNTVLVGDAGTGSLYQLSLNEQGLPINPVVLYREVDLFVTAITFDSSARPLFTNWRNDRGELLRLEKDNTVTLLADGFRAPLGLSFINGKVYIVNSDIKGIIPRVLGVIPSPYRATLPFTIDVITLPQA
jgi:hypothetical protein